MNTYPTTIALPDASGFQEALALDPTLRSETESGRVITRNRFTKVPKIYKLVYVLLANTDKETLEVFETDVGFGAEAFEWQHPLTSDIKIVRFAKPILFNYASNNADEWNVQVELQEI